MSGFRLIDIDKREGAKFTTFPDSQPHIQIEGMQGIYAAIVVCSITSAQKLMELKMVGDALNRAGVHMVLHIPYLMGARYDRVMQEGDSFDLKVIAEDINNIGFDRVTLYDPHSDVAAALIDNAEIVTNKKLVESYKEKNAVLIVPDAGAAKKSEKYLEWNKNITDIIYCIKKRDVSNGRLTLTVLEPENCANRPCVIIDDLCDGGRTFTAIADRLLPFKPSKLTLIVTHGIFSAGFEELEKRFDEIIVSDSYQSSYPDAKKLTLVKYDTRD